MSIDIIRISPQHWLMVKNQRGFQFQRAMPVQVKEGAATQNPLVNNHGTFN